MAAKRKTSTKTSAKKVKDLKSLAQTHGKEETFEPTTLDQIWGDDGLSVYGTMDENHYENELDEMNLSDLQAHASRVGIIPIDNRATLRERLLREFRKHVASYKKPVSPPAPQHKVDSEAMKILSEGR